jgi:hypothetical protein
MRVYGDSVPVEEEEVAAAAEAESMADEMRKLRLLVEKQGKQITDQQLLLDQLFKLVIPKSEVVEEALPGQKQPENTDRPILV